MKYDRKELTMNDEVVVLASGRLPVNDEKLIPTVSPGY
jgi:hypothetical protein